MSKTKFTNGPWKVQDDGYGLIGVTFRKGFGLLIGRKNQETIANANLIALAPEMYEMIEQLSSELLHAIGEVNDMRKAKVYGSDLTQPDLWDAESCYLADRLLAKARGEQK